MQQHIEEQKQGQQEVAEQFHSFEKSVDSQLSSVLDNAAESSVELERLRGDSRDLLAAIQAELDQATPDLENLRKEVKKLNHALEKSERRVKLQLNELATAKG